MLLLIRILILDLKLYNYDFLHVLEVDAIFDDEKDDAGRLKEEDDVSNGAARGEVVPMGRLRGLAADDDETETEEEEDTTPAAPTTPPPGRTNLDFQVGQSFEASGMGPTYTLLLPYMDV